MNEQPLQNPEPAGLETDLNPSAAAPGMPTDPFAGGDFVEQQQFERAAGSGGGPSRLNRSTLILIGVFLAGAGVVAFLAMRSGPQQATASDKDLETRVEQFLAKDAAKRKTGPDQAKPENLPDSREVVEEFFNYASRRQVPLEDLKSNPFVFGAAEEEPKASTDDGSAAARRAAAEAAAKRKKQLQTELAGLTLQSVMPGRQGSAAIVNNNFVAVHDKLGSFTVTRIGAQSIELTADGVTFTLALKN